MRRIQPSVGASSPFYYQLDSLACQARGRGGAVGFDVETQQWLGSRETQQHPRSIIEDKFCAIGAIDGNHFSPQERRSVQRNSLDGVCFLFVAELQVFA